MPLSIEGILYAQASNATLANDLKLNGLQNGMSTTTNSQNPNMFAMKSINKNKFGAFSPQSQNLGGDHALLLNHPSEQQMSLPMSSQNNLHNTLNQKIRNPYPYASAGKAPLSSQQMKPQATKSTNLLTNELLV